MRLFHWRRRQTPILVGPWRSELGFEVLYWLPFLAAWLARTRIDPARLVAISRGGASAWYRAGQTVELYDYWSLQALRLEALRAQEATGSIKQFAVTPMERALYASVAARLGLRRYRTLHPSVMYRTLAPWWGDQMGLARLLTHLTFEPFHTIPLPIGLSLPDEFVCVRFYERYTWPLTEEVRDYCAGLVGHLAKTRPVVVLGSGHHHDEHLDLNITGPNILTLADTGNPRENLAVQAAVLAKASGFLGTYGGMLQLAVRMGKPSVGLYQRLTGTADAHIRLTQWLARQQRIPCVIAKPEDAVFLGPIFEAKPPLPSPIRSSGGAE